MRRVNTRIEHVRESIPHTLSGVALLLAQHQWVMSVDGDTHIDTLERYLVSANTNNFAGFRVGGYAMGYYTQNDEKSIVEGARRLAELCLQMRETFPQHMPGQTVSLDGCIEEDVQGTLAMADGNLALLNYLSSTRMSCRKGHLLPVIQNGFIRCLFNHKDELLLSAREISAIKKELIDASSC